VPPFPGIPEKVLETLPPPPAAAVERLRRAVAAVADPPEGPLERLLDYGRLVLAANTRTNLTGARSWEALLDLHLLDCAEAVRFLPPGLGRIHDLGSGAGLPGLVWAILMPETEFVLLERNGKKAAFLAEAAERLDLGGVEVVRAAAEEQLHHARPEALSARAVEPLARLLARLRRARLRPGHLFLFGGPRFAADWAALPGELRAGFREPRLAEWRLPGPDGAERQRLLAWLRPAPEKGLS